MTSQSTLSAPIARYLYTALESVCDPGRAPGMEAYMKHQFSFFGVPAPQRKVISMEARKNYSLSLEEPFPVWIRECWDSPFREMQYAAMDILLASHKKLNESHLPMLEWCITHKSWWDTVDAIAPGMAGAVFKKNLSLRDTYIQSWRNSDHLWLIRSSILFQLKYGKGTDWPLLADIIMQHALSRDFFIRKAQGWALRQYGRVAPEVIREFVVLHPELSGLTKREALKHL